MVTRLADFILTSPSRLFIPIGIYAGLKIIGATVRQAVSEAEVQAQAALAFQEALKIPAVLTAMDLSVEAEALGCQVRFSDNEVPTVLGRRVQSPEDIRHLPLPQIGDGRTGLYLEVARKLVSAGRRLKVPVLATSIGPFSLAGRIFGLSEALEISVSEPKTLEALLEKTTTFLIDYHRAFCSTGVDGLIIAEPAAGLLSPRGLARFSAPYIQRMVRNTQTRRFAIILHSCSARLVHLPEMLASGVEIFHFSSPMDMKAALERVHGKVILGGNLDPTDVFYLGPPERVREKAQALLDSVQTHSNFFLSSGCDIPPGTPLENIRACVPEGPIPSHSFD